LQSSTSRANFIRLIGRIFRDQNLLGAPSLSAAIDPGTELAVLAFPSSRPAARHSRSGRSGCFSWFDGRSRGDRTLRRGEHRDAPHLAKPAKPSARDRDHGAQGQAGSAIPARTTEGFTRHLQSARCRAQTFRRQPPLPPVRAIHRWTCVLPMLLRLRKRTPAWTSRLQVAHDVDAMWCAVPSPCSMVGV
jgi:hypothetical protein